ncbi:MAG: ATP-binding protein [Micrococcales bacterium]|nr:MAG: ATP-binding protein [Micrococcales bacterium]PIE26384.1 MAG: ATP-binding protein [Micrococcales bacterium]
MADSNNDLVAEVQEGYRTDGPALELGALLHDEQAQPQAGVRIPLRVLNRHGLIAGATGTGKTKTLQVLAEQLSAQGVPVFLADVKGDLSGLAAPGEADDRITERAQQVGQDWVPTAAPCEFYSLGGRGTGLPIRATITEFGPVLLSKILDLTDVQSSSLNMVFYFADKAGLPLLDLKDLRAVIQYLTSEDGKKDLKGIGGISTSTANVLLRELIAFEEDGADVFFGEPQFDPQDLLRTTPDGKGIVSCLELPGVQTEPRLFSTFLMWLLVELFETLPEVGDPEKPKMVFFFDEAHLLFKDASKEFLEQITQTVRLIRSKGVGVFFVTQQPTDVPRDVLAQLGSRVQHALRAFTPEDAKALRETAKTYPDSGYDLTEVLTQLGTGEAVVTVLSEKGAPTPVAWTRLRAPLSLMAPIPEADLQATVDASPLAGKYGEVVDRESAYEKLAARVQQPEEIDGQERIDGQEKAEKDRQLDELAAQYRDQEQRSPDYSDDKPARRRDREPEPESGMAERVLESSAFRSFTRSAATVIGREITRSLFGVRRRRR